jgi:pyroglutamyl-peptidase
MSVLLTGFGAFGNVGVNPSEQVAGALDGEQVAGHRVHSVVLPVATDRVAAALSEATQAVNPDLILCLGVAPGRTAAALERVAVNVKDFPLPDVDGRSPIDEPVLPQGPAAYLSTVPAKAILARWTTEQIPGYLSNTAGTYVCNQVFYLASHHAQLLRIPAGLIHLPSTPGSITHPTPGKTPPPTAQLDTLTHAVQLAIDVTLTHRGADLRLPAGAVS